MDIDMNSTISGGSAEDMEAGILHEILCGEEYDELIAQAKMIFAGSLGKDNHADTRNDHAAEVFSAGVHKSEDDLEMFVQSMIEKTAAALQRDYKRRHKSMQAQGIAAAKARGVRCGRPEKELPENFRLIAEEQACGRISMRTAASLCGMSVSTFARRKKKMTESVGR